MAANGTESIPSSWDDERDAAFFRISADLFSCDFTYGAGVLLASYDDAYESATIAMPETESVATGTPHGLVSAQIGPDHIRR